MDAKLRVVGGAKPAIIRLRLPTIVGRSSNANLKVKNSQISRRHCEIDEYDGELVVRDLDSSNGTYVNNERITDTTFLSPGDELRIGPLTLRAEYEIVESTAAETDDSCDQHAADVVGDEPDSSKPAGNVSSVLRYEENKTGGSFLGIEEVEDTDGSEPLAEEPATEESPLVAAKDTVTEPEHAIDVETGVEKQQSVDPGDSRLKDFFNNLS